MTSTTPIYDDVRRALGKAERVDRRRDGGADGHGADAADDRGARPIMLRGHGGRHRRDLD